MKRAVLMVWNVVLVEMVRFVMFVEMVESVWIVLIVSVRFDGLDRYVR